METREFMNALKSIVVIETVYVIVQEGNKLPCVVTVAEQNKRWLLPFVLLK